MQRTRHYDLPTLTAGCHAYACVSMSCSADGTCLRKRRHGTREVSLLGAKQSDHNPRSARGFTLLELLVAMLMMVTIASCLYAALHTGFQARRSALIAVGPTAQAIDAIELLKQDLYGVLPPGGALGGGFIGEDSVGIRGGDTDSLEFYTTHVYAGDATQKA